MEIGEKQKNFSTKILVNNGFYINSICKDFSGKDRCLISTKIYKWTILKITIEEIDISQMEIEVLEKEMEMDIK